MRVKMDLNTWNFAFSPARAVKIICERRGVQVAVWKIWTGSNTFKWCTWLVSSASKGPPALRVRYSTWCSLLTLSLWIFQTAQNKIVNTFFHTSHLFNPTIWVFLFRNSFFSSIYILKYELKIKHFRIIFQPSFLWIFNFLYVYKIY